MKTIAKSTLANTLLILILLANFWLQLQVLSELSNASPYFTAIPPDTDQAFYAEWARNLLNGTWPGNRAFFNSPYYPYYLALIYTIGEDNYTPRIIQMLMGVLTCALVYQIGTTIAGRRTGLIAAVLISLYGPIAFYNQEYTTAPHNMLLVTSAVYFALRLSKNQNPINALALGTAVGFGTLGQPQIAIILPAILIWLWHKRISRVLISYAAVLFPFAIIVGLPTAHNLIAANQLGVVTTSGPYNLYIGNNPDATGTFYVIDPAVRRSFDNSDYLIAVVDYIRQQPASWLFLTANKTASYLLRSDAELGSNVNYHYWGVAYSPTLQRLPLNLELVVIFALVSLPMVRRKPSFSLLFACILSYSLATIVIFVQARFRIVIMPLVLIVMAAAIHEMWIRFSHSKSRKWVLLLLGAVLLAYLPLAIRYRMAIDQNVFIGG